MTDSVWVKTINPEELHPVGGLDGVWNRWVTPNSENRGMIFAMGELKPGEAAGWHAHPEPELFFVLLGHGLAFWKDKDGEHQAALYPGTAFYKIGGIPHQMVNTGDSVLRGVALKIGQA